MHRIVSPVRLAIFALLGAAAGGAAVGGAAQAAKGGGDAALQTTLAQPAPEGAVAVAVETLADGLANPWSLAFLPNGDVLVTERAGRLRIIRDGALVDAPVAGVPEIYVGGTSWSQAGFFDVVADPDFAENDTVFIAYAHGTARRNGLRVARARFVDDALVDVTPIYDAAPPKDTPLHYGGRLAIGADGMVYVSIGEGARYKERAQDYATSYGAVVRITKDGAIPDDNPPFDKSDARPELYSKGHRNPQGLAFDPETGTLWEHEHGAKGGDEINRVEPGANYGWPLATYGVDYNGARISPFTTYEGTVQPVKYWTPSIAPSGLAVYRGDLFPEDWAGDLLVGGLVSRALHRVDMDGAAPVGEERYLADLGERIREVRVGPDGAIYATTEERGGEPVGKVLRITPAQ
ncbi:MAG: PQQ-dependent sugar dehydrogenase [Pseudomonadota bacterium]